MSRKATVYDVAEAAGVSIATVSRVLRQPDTVRESTRERVLAAVGALGYVPSGNARGLAERRTGVLGLYFPGFDAAEDAPPFDVHDLATPTGEPFTVVSDGADDEPARPVLFLDEVLRGAEMEAWRQGFVLMIGVGRDDPARETVRDIAGRVDGLIVLARSVPDEVLARLSSQIPVVVLAGPPRGDDFDHVTVGNAAAMAELTRLVLADADPGRIAFLAGPVDSPDAAQRWDGFAAAVHELGIDDSDVTVVRGDFTRESGVRAAATLLDGGAPSAVIAANDQMALGLIDAFATAGVRVPDDVRVSGFDGIEEGIVSRPSLTTVRQPMVDLGRAAVQLLVRRLGQPDAAPSTVALPVRILLRESSRKPDQASSAAPRTRG